MTRANINFVSQARGESPKTLFHYWNGDGYPTGMVDVFNLYSFLDSDWTREDFKKWVTDTYTDYVAKMRKEYPRLYADPSWNDPIEAEEKPNPYIYYTDGFITDYSYVFEAARKEVVVYEWDKRVFKGSVKRFKNWIAKQRNK